MAACLCRKDWHLTQMFLMFTIVAGAILRCADSAYVQSAAAFSLAQAVLVADSDTACAHLDCMSFSMAVCRLYVELT
jgi:hypothetical protein